MREKAQTGLRWALVLFGALVLLVLLFNFLRPGRPGRGLGPGAVQLLVLRLAGVGTGTFSSWSSCSASSWAWGSGFT